MQRVKTLRANELESPQAAPRKSFAHSVRNPAACRDCPAGQRQCQPSSWSNDRLVKKHSGVEALVRLEHYLRPQALTTWAGRPGGSGEPPLPSLVPSGVGAMESPAVASHPLRDLNRPIAASATPRLMKQILLRVPAVFAEIGFGELAKPLHAHLPSPRKIMLPQHALDPDIDRECSQPLIRKKHHAICNLRPHAWQRAQLFSELGVG